MKQGKQCDSSNRRSDIYLPSKEITIPTREAVKLIPDDVTDESEMIKLALRSIKK